MVQKLMASTMTGTGQDESALILIKHCRDMKQQETRLRLFTLLLLLSCATMFIFTICFDVRQHVNSAPDSQKLLKLNLQRPHILLRSGSETDKGYMKWQVELKEKISTEENAIVIPQSGIYFIYVQIALVCYNVTSQAGERKFYMELHKWSEGYNRTQRIIEASDTLDCTPGFRTVFVGQLYDFLQDDRVKVWIRKSNALIRKASFGVYPI